MTIDPSDVQWDDPSAIPSPVVGMPANGTKYSPAQMQQLNAARDALRAAENRGEPYTYNAIDPSKVQWDQPATNNADAALGGTLRLGVPFTSLGVDTGIPLPSSVEAGIVGAGKTVSDWINGARQLTASSQPSNLSDIVTGQTPASRLATQVASDNAAYAPLAQAHPVSTFVGSAAPYYAAGVPGAIGLSALSYGTPQERAAAAALTAGGALVGKGVARMFGPHSMAGVPRATVSAAGNPWGIPTTVGMNGSPTAKLAESVVANLPFVNGSVNAARNAAFQGFNRAVTNTFGEDSGQITPELLGQARSTIGQTIGDIAGRNNIAADQTLFTQLQAASQRASQELTPDEARIVNGQIQSIWNAVDPNTGAIPGTLYKALQSKMGEIGQSRGGTISNIMGDTRAAMRDAMTRSVSPDDAAAWQKANSQYFNVQQVAKAAQRTPGSLSPSQLLTQVNAAQKASKFGGGNELADLARWAKPTLTDQIPNSGTAQRMFMQKVLTNPITGLAELGGLGYLANETDHPLLAGSLGLLSPLLIGRALAGSPASPLTQQLLMRAGATTGLLGYNAATQ